MFVCHSRDRLPRLTATALFALERVDWQGEEVTEAAIALDDRRRARVVLQPACETHHSDIVAATSKTNSPFVSDTVLPFGSSRRRARRSSRQPPGQNPPSFGSRARAACASVRRLHIARARANNSLVLNGLVT